MEKSGEEIFRPYARLITILGDQLITNKLVAVNEIIKNSYDADAEKVSIRFKNIENIGKKGLLESQKPIIEIEDDGDGMTIDTIRNVWLRPATPNKFNIKKGKKRFTPKGRLMQGEKGIGRFAVHKLGDEINIYTKKEKREEAHLVLDLTEYERGPQLELFTSQKEIDSNYKFLDEIKNKWYEYKSPKKIKKAHGTLIQIRNLRDKWTSNDLELLSKSLANLISPVIPDEDREKLNLGLKLVKDFNINIEWNGSPYSGEGSNVTFESVCDEAPFKFIGEIDQKGSLTYEYTSILAKKRNAKRKINLLENELPITLYTINSRFYERDKKTREKIKTHEPNVGPFKFILYGFDLFNKTKWKNKQDELDFIKDNSVYVFRDGVRVYPYGNKDIDWLEISKKRAEYKAGDFFSYNDLIGFVFISHDANENLKDATNREGLMDIHGAYEDFKALMIASTQVMKYESDKDKGEVAQREHKPLEIYEKSLDDSYSVLAERLKKIKDAETKDAAKKYLETTKTYLKESNKRIDIYEDLAGLGLAIEKASHDAFSILSKIILNLRDLKKKLTAQNINKKELQEFVKDIEESSLYLYDQLQIIQPLFRQTKRTETNVSVEDVVKKLLRYFRVELESYNIKVNVHVIKDIKIKTSIGLILQILINLMDNSVYWLKEKGSVRSNEITIKINGNKNEIIFADNGIGIDPEVSDLIFIEFFTTKPKERGRGLGLFIVKEIVDRLGGSVEVIKGEKQKVLKGANFRILFPKK